jgi:hypothetical protein
MHTRCAIVKNEVCGGRLRLLATVEEPQVVEKMLSHLGIPTECPEPCLPERHRGRRRTSRRSLVAATVGGRPSASAIDRSSSGGLSPPFAGLRSECRAPNPAHLH